MPVHASVDKSPQQVAPPTGKTDFSMFHNGIKPTTAIIYEARDTMYKYSLKGDIDSTWKRHPVSEWG